MSRQTDIPRRKLFHVEQVNLTKGPMTLYGEFILHHVHKALSLKKAHVVAFVNRRRTQILFVHGFTWLAATLMRMGEMPGEQVSVSTRFKIDPNSKRTWTEINLRRFANISGFEIEGIGDFPELFEEIEEEKPTAKKNKRIA